MPQQATVKLMGVHKKPLAQRSPLHLQKLQKNPHRHSACDFATRQRRSRRSNTPQRRPRTQPVQLRTETAPTSLDASTPLLFRTTPCSTKRPFEKGRRLDGQHPRKTQRSEPTTARKTQTKQITSLFHCAHHLSAHYCPEFVMVALKCSHRLYHFILLILI